MLNNILVESVTVQSETSCISQAFGSVGVQQVQRISENLQKQNNAENPGSDVLSHDHMMCQQL